MPETVLDVRRLRHSLQQCSLGLEPTDKTQNVSSPGHPGREARASADTPAENGPPGARKETPHTHNNNNKTSARHPADALHTPGTSTNKTQNQHINHSQIPARKNSGRHSFGRSVFSAPEMSQFSSRLPVRALLPLLHFWISSFTERRAPLLQCQTKHLA